MTRRTKPRAPNPTDQQKTLSSTTSAAARTDTRDREQSQQQGAGRSLCFGGGARRRRQHRAARAATAKHSQQKRERVCPGSAMAEAAGCSCSRRRRRGSGVVLLACAAAAVIAAVVSSAGTAAAAHSAAEEGRLPGWHGESYRPGGNGGDDGQRRKWVETISWAPRAFIYHNFLSHEEVDHLILLAERELTRSHVVDTETGEVKLDAIRTSYGAPLQRGQTPVVAAIEDRIAEWTRLPPSHGEPLQVLRYADGQEYKAHFDWFENPKNTHGAGENRAATVLMYLADVEPGAGGETALPLGKPIDAARQRLAAPSECAQRGDGLAVVPRRGDALLFWDLHPDGRTVDRTTLHASCPTVRGTKYTATKWLHNRPMGVGLFDGDGSGGYQPVELAGACEDADDDCAAAAAAGKCDSEPRGMLGVGGRCRRSCRDCVECPRGDLLCLRRNMRSLRAQLAAQGEQQQQQQQQQQQGREATTNNERGAPAMVTSV